MSFRDDHDAAIARIDSLEHELATATERNATLEAKVSRLQREIRRLEGNDDATIEFMPVREHQLPGWISVASRVLGLVVFAMLALIIVLGATAPG